MRHRYSERECSRTGQQEAAAICTVFITWVLYDWGRLKKKKDGQALAGQHHALATPETDVSVVTVCAGGLASDSRTGARAAFERSGWGEELIDVATGNGAGWKRGARRVEAAPRCVREGWGADGAMLRCSGAGWGAGRRRFRAGRRARGAGCGCGALVGRVGCRDIPREGGDQRKVEFCKAKKKKKQCITCTAAALLRLHLPYRAARSGRGTTLCFGKGTPSHVQLSCKPLAPPSHLSAFAFETRIRLAQAAFQSVSRMRLGKRCLPSRRCPFAYLSGHAPSVSACSAPLHRPLLTDLPAN